MKEVEQYKQLFDRNIERVHSLRRLYNSLKSDDVKEGHAYKFTDILRAAVVLLHSAFEEYYRNILICILSKKCTKDNLKNISFLGSAGNHKEKITLGGLLEFREKTVDQLITESIRESLNFTSFNEYQDIIFWSKKIRIDLSEYKDVEKLNRLIQRRHKIVHEADNAKDNDEYKLSPILEGTVKEWIEIVCDLVKIIDNELHKEQ